MVSMLNFFASRGLLIETGRPLILISPESADARRTGRA